MGVPMTTKAIYSNTIAGLHNPPISYRVSDSTGWLYVLYVAFAEHQDPCILRTIDNELSRWCCGARVRSQEFSPRGRVSQGLDPKTTIGESGTFTFLYSHRAFIYTFSTSVACYILNCVVSSKFCLCVVQFCQFVELTVISFVVLVLIHRGRSPWAYKTRGFMPLLSTRRV